MVTEKVSRRPKTKRKLTNKYCSKCDWGLPIRFFNKEIRNTDGLRSECKICQYGRMGKALTKKSKELRDERESLCN